MTQVIGIILVLLSVGILIFWLATGRRSKPLLKFVCMFIAAIGFLLILKDKLAEVTIKDWLSIKTSVAEATADAKTIAAIKQQVENQRATIDLVATDAQNAKNLSEEASNKVALAEEKLRDLDDAIQKANDSLEKLDAATEFTLLVAKAESGNRAAFFKLIQSKFASLSEQAIAQDICDTITSKIESEVAVKQATGEMEWINFGLDPQKVSLQEYKKLYSEEFSRVPGARFFITKQIFNDNRFSEVDRFAFVAMVMQQDNDLEVLQEACLLMDTKRKSNQNILHADDYLSWYKDYQTNFKATP